MHPLPSFWPRLIMWLVMMPNSWSRLNFLTSFLAKITNSKNSLVDVFVKQVMNSSFLQCEHSLNYIKMVHSTIVFNFLFLDRCDVSKVKFEKSDCKAWAQSVQFAAIRVRLVGFSGSNIDSSIYPSEGKSWHLVTNMKLSEFFFWWLQVALIADCYMFIDLFALQHWADRPG